MNNDNPYQPPETTEVASALPMEVHPGALRKTRVGLFSVYYGICAVLLGVVVGMLVMFAGGGVAWMGILAAILLIGGVFGGSLAILAGQIMCLTVPQESGARSYVQTTVALQGLSIVLGFVSMAAVMFAGVSGNGDATSMVGITSNVVSVINGILGLASSICFVLFLKKLAQHIRRVDLASSASTILKMVVAVVAIYFIMLSSLVSAVFLGGGEFGLVIGIFALVFLVLALATFIKYANLVLYLARAIPS